MIELPHGFMLETMPMPEGFDMFGFAADQRENFLRQHWREKGSLNFCAWLDGKAPWGETRLLVLMPKSVVDNTTSVAGQIIRRLVKKLDSTAVLVTMEAWFAVLEDPEGEGPHKARAKLPKSLADYDKRKECLWMSCEVRGKDQQAWRAQIHRDPDRVDPFVPFEPPGGMEGRLVSWFAEGVG